MEVDEKPTEDYSDIGGLDKQIQELVEAIVLPVTHAVSSYSLHHRQTVFEYTVHVCLWGSSHTK